MKKVFQSILIALTVLMCVNFLLSWQGNKKKEREFYQLTVFHFTTTEQEKLLDNYFQNALLPALHRTGARNVGVFKSWANDTATDKLVYVFIPLRSLDALIKNKEQLKKDQLYNTAASDYLNADPRHPVYTRMETIVLRAFPLAAQMHLPSFQRDLLQRSDCRQ